MSREMNEGELEIAMRELSPRTPQDAEAVARPDLPADGFRWWAVVRDSDDKVVAERRLMNKHKFWHCDISTYVDDRGNIIWEQGDAPGPLR